MNNDQLVRLLELLKTDIINSLQTNSKNATGQTAKQLTIIEDSGIVQLQAPSYMELLETGRRPTSPDAVAGNPPMIQRIQQWCRAKGIPEKAAWAIKKSIDKKGFRGIPGLLSEPLGDENINMRLKAVIDNIAASVSNELALTIK